MAPVETRRPAARGSVVSRRDRAIRDVIRRRGLRAKLTRACGHQEELEPPANLVTREALMRWARARARDKCADCEVARSLLVDPRGRPVGSGER